MATTIICINNTASPVLIGDLGTVIPGSGQDTLTDLFSLDQITNSNSLFTLCTNNAVSPGVSTLKLNNGVSDIPPNDIQSYLLEYGFLEATRFVPTWKWGEG